MSVSSSNHYKQHVRDLGETVPETIFLIFAETTQNQNKKVWITMHEQCYPSSYWWDTWHILQHCFQFKQPFYWLVYIAPGMISARGFSET